MKKSILIACVAAAFLAESALATVAFTATPSTQNAVAGGTFNVTFGLAVDSSGGGPTNPLAAFDLYLATAAANSGLFSITSATGIAPWTSTGPGSFSPDPLSTAAATGFVRNGIDMGFSATSFQSLPYTGNIETLSFLISNSVAPGTYTFSTTTSTNAGVYYSDVSDSMGNVFEGLPGTFQITIQPSEVPEASTWMTGCLAAGVIGYTMLRRRKLA